MGYPTNYLLNRIQNYQHGGKKPLFCVRICNKNDILCRLCGKKVSSLWMGRIYCQDSGGDPLSWGISTVECWECGQVRYLKGWLPTTIQIWKQDEGLLCCGIQTKLVGWEENQ